MIETLKNMIWDYIKDKEVALFKIFSNEGEILYHRGRDVKGRTIVEGKGFCRSHCLEALKVKRGIGAESCLVNLNGNGFSESAQLLQVKQLLIFPVSVDLFFYLDSGCREPFREKEISELKILGRHFSRQINGIKRSEQGAEGICGRSEAAERIRSLVRKYAIVDEPVLLLGETGVGKNRVAELIHKYSGKKGDFVSVHTPGVSKDLFESQLFGHRRGSFTGAIADTTGYVAQAEGGTLFFDEISELPLPGQAKLLRLIDIKSFTRLGDAVERRADVRIVAATNKDLRKLIAENHFREDLYFRLNVLPIHIPPLRKRREDIKDLLEEFAGKLKGKKLGKEAVRVLLNYSWPGNIRELNSVLTRAGIDHNAPEIGSEIAEYFEKGFPFFDTVGGNGKVDKIWLELMNKTSFWNVIWEPFIAREIDRETVKAVLIKAYNEKGCNYKKMLQILNIEEKKYHCFMTLLHKYRILPK
ncbi:MAG: sigma 54-interacting transcriptional regulator [Acidobacteria bacterium]|nr:sigma 54-interacting transcriptional regulator [Acidobacteriota bacterium]